MIFMWIFNRLKNRKNFENHIIKEYERLRESDLKKEKKIARLSEKLKHAQHITIDLDTSSNVDFTTYTGNNYKSYDGAVTAINQKYNCEADWGCLLAGVIIDMRAALIQGGDIEMAVKKTDSKADEPTEQERAFIEEFMSYNKLDDYQVFDNIKSTEIEGRLLLKLEKNEEHEWRANGGMQKGMIAIVPYLYSDNKYKVTVDRFKKPDSIIFSEKKVPDFTDGNEFVYRKFGGKVNAYNSPAMRVWRCLTNIEYVDKAIRDLRKINHVFVSPKAFITVKDGKEVDETSEYLNENWKSTTISVLTGELKYLQISVEHVEILVKEIYINIQMIGAATGLPVHWLALVDLMSNRSTADDLGDITEMAVSTERKIFFDGLNEALNKSIDLYNSFSNRTAIRKGIFSLEPNIISDEQWKHLKEIFLELIKIGKFSLKEFYKLIPGVDAEEAYKAFQQEVKEDIETKYSNFPEPPDDEDDSGEEE